MRTYAEPLKYKYIMNVKLSHVKGSTLINSVFPKVEDLMLSSKMFDEFEPVLNSLNSLNTELTMSLNKAANEERYGILSEINPARSGQETISKDWDTNEVAKVWIIDKIAQQEKPGPIKAISLAQILESHDEPVIMN